MNNESATTAVAMSGGVDSSVVAGLLQRRGLRVVGLTMQLWNQRRMPELTPEGGATNIATGHYARLAYDEAGGRYQLRRSVDAAKDQTYFLFGLKQEQLARTQFPLGEFTKPQVRDLARDLGLPVAEKPDSQEICFVPNGDYAGFIDAYF